MDIAFDADLVKQAQALAVATREDFAAAIVPHLGKMANLAARLADERDRDDIVQEAMARAWLKRSHFDPSRGSLSSWLLAITADQARKARQRRFRRSVPYVAPAAVESPEERLDVEIALRQLSPRQRLAIDCFYFAGLSVLETAAIMNCSEGTVKSTLADARKALRPWLETRP